MKIQQAFIVALIGVCALIASQAQAVPIIYFGEDLSPGGVVSPTGAPAIARAAFLSQLVGVGSEDFEGFAAPTGANLAINFPGSAGSITASITGTSGGVCQENGAGVSGISCSNSFGRFATSGDQYYNTTGTFTIAFSEAISAFGFFATDIGDFNGQVTATLTGGDVVNLVVPSTINGPNASLLFWGFIDQAASYTSLTFGNTAAGTDVFGFDDMVIGDREQIIPGVPEPGAAILFVLGTLLVGVGTSRRR